MEVHLIQPGSRWIDAGLVCAALVAVYLLPRLAPYVAVAGVMLQTSVIHYSSDLDILLGTVLGLVLRRQPWLRRPNRPPVTPAIWALAGLNVLALLSLAANFGGPYGHDVWLNTEYFVAHALLLGAIWWLGVLRSEHGTDWLIAIGAAGLLFGVYRLAQLAGAPVHKVAHGLGLAPLGDQLDVGTWNLFALLGLMAALFLLGPAGVAGVSARRTALGVVLSAVTLIGVTSATSRTALAVVLLGLLWMILVSRTTVRRGLLAGLGVVAVAVSFTPAFSIASKPVVVQQKTIQGEKTAAGAPPIPVGSSTSVGPPPGHPEPDPPPAIQPQWRSVLDRTRYHLEQVVDNPTLNGPGKNYLIFLGRTASHGTDAELDIAINGVTVNRLHSNDLLDYYNWVVVALSDRVMDPQRMVISFSVSGTPDSQNNYFAVAGFNATAPGLTSRFRIGAQTSTDDLSSDPGIQRGLLMVFLNGQLPPYATFAQPAGPVLDPSLDDRLTLWQIALQIFERHPLLGTGFYTFDLSRSEVPATRLLFLPYTNAHSNYLELLSDLGFLGPLLFAMVFILALAVAGRRALADRLDWQAATLAAAMGACLLASIDQTWTADSRIYATAWILVFLVSVRGRPAATSKS
jgi:hypothetical protein